MAHWRPGEDQAAEAGEEASPPAAARALITLSSQQQPLASTASHCLEKSFCRLSATGGIVHSSFDLRYNYSFPVMYSRHWHCRGLIFVPVLASIATIIWFTFIAAANERQITPSSIVNGTTHSLVTSVAPSIQYCLGDFINSRDAVGAESCFRVLDDWMVQYFDRRQQKLLILNKVPKCGSTEMYHLLKGLSRKHNFQYKSLQKEYWGSSEHHLGLWVEEVGNMVKMAYLQEDKAAVLDGHAAWIDFAAQVSSKNFATDVRMMQVNKCIYFRRVVMCLYMSM